MTDAGFQVQAEAIVRHAAAVNEVAAQVAQARSASATVTLGRDAYGMLCQLIPVLLNPVQEAVIEAFQEAGDSLQRAADDLRTTAADYNGADQSATDQLGRGR